jgi:hypothetical protein
MKHLSLFIAFLFVIAIGAAGRKDLCGSASISRLRHGHCGNDRLGRKYEGREKEA